MQNWYISVTYVLESEYIDSVNIHKLQTTLLMENLMLKYCHYELDHLRKVRIRIWILLKLSISLFSIKKFSNKDCMRVCI
jgi:hypothetical protein